MNRYQFKPKLSMTLATFVVMAVCVWAGLWQYDKGQARIVAQKQIDQGMARAPVGLPDSIKNKEDWQYKRVQFKGVYMPKYQMLLDNRVHQGKAGYQIVTPVKLDSEAYVLVNRGWVPANAERTLPAIETPTGEHLFVGDLFFPLDSVFTLETKEALNADWQPLWQHIDMKRYQSLVPFKVKPYMTRLAKDSSAGGFVRAWPVPKNRVKVHLGYAYQWFGFASTFFVIYIVLNFKRLKREDRDNE